MIGFVQVHDKNQSRFMVQLLVGAVSFGAAFSYFATNVNMNPKPHHLLKN